MLFLTHLDEVISKIRFKCTVQDMFKQKFQYPSISTKQVIIFLEFKYSTDVLMILFLSRSLALMSVLEDGIPLHSDRIVEKDLSIIEKDCHS